MKAYAIIISYRLDDFANKTVYHIVKYHNLALEIKNIPRNNVGHKCISHLTDWYDIYT